MKNPFGITERKCMKKDYRFFRDLIVETMKPLVIPYFDFDYSRVRLGFVAGLKSTKILMKGKKRIGFYQITPKGKVLDITRIYLTKGHRKKGIGTFIMQYFETLGYEKIILEVWDNNSSKQIYKNLGYKIVKKRNHKICMEKKIKK